MVRREVKRRIKGQRPHTRRSVKGKVFNAGNGIQPKTRKEDKQYNKILTPQNKKIINDSVKASIAENNNTVLINTNRMISLHEDKLTPKEYSKFDSDKAEDFILDYANKKFDKAKALQKERELEGITDSFEQTMRQAKFNIKQHKKFIK